MSQQPELRKARAIRRDLVPSHLQTKVSQDNRKIEQSLLTDLNRYVNLIRAELDRNPSFQWTHLRALIIPMLRDSVAQTMRGHIEQSYLLGSKYITDKTGLEGASFLTHSDIDNIKALTQEFTDKFFGRVQLSLDNTLSKRFTKREPDSPINPNFIVTSIAISAASKAIAEGTRMKAKSLLQSLSNQQSILQAAATKKKKKRKREETAAAEVQAHDLIEAEEAFGHEIEALSHHIAGYGSDIAHLLISLFGSEAAAAGIAATTGLGVGIGVNLATLAASTLEQQEWLWVCAEDPCPICQDLEGQVFTMDDIDLAPQPLEDTHPNCRCRLLLL